MEVSQLDTFKKVLEDHVEDLRRLLQEFSQKAGSDNPRGERASQSVDRFSPNDAVQPLHNSASCGATSTAAHGGTTVPAEDLAEDCRSSPRNVATPVAGKLVIDEDGKLSGGSAEPASAALAIAVDLARQALQDAESRLPPDAQADDDLAKASKQLGEARKLLAVSSPSLAGGGAAGPLPSTRQTAKAYDCVRKARQLVHRARPGAEKPVKDAALVIREVLTLQCCAGASSLSGSAFEASLIDAFDRSLESELNSQLHLSRSSICRLAREPAKFDKQLPRIYGRQLSDEDSMQLFSAYNAVSVASKGKKEKAPRPAKEKGAGPQTQTASECPQTQQASEGEHTQTGNMGADGAQAAAGSKGEHPQYPWNMGDPLKVSMPSSNFGPPLSVFEGSGGGRPWDIWGTSRCGACGAIL